ncbi:MFS transporter [Kitasatospora sp. NPDC049258]|uniref:MFS transporter n=1 Tax=Kitasatospora sp. NPDC049258 TaxID=3155394 RepID=UPI00341B684B
MTTWEPALRAAAGHPRRALRSPVVAATLLAALLHGLWALFLAADAGDLAAQYAWTDFTMEHPDSAYNLSWYGGIHPASYSLLSPYLIGELGVRTTGVLAGTLAAALAAGLLVRAGLVRPMAPALWTALALSCNAVSGRVTFAVGVALGLAALAPALGPPGAGRRVAAFLLAALATMNSPVAGLFLVVAAAALTLTGRHRSAATLATGPVLVVAGTALAFPFHGVQPFDWWVAAPLLAALVAGVLLVPRAWRAVRAGAAVYAAGVAVTWAVPSPVGSNVERLALLFAGTVLLAAALEARADGRADGWAGGRPDGWAGRRRWLVLGVAFLAVAAWQVGKPVGDLISAGPSAGETRPTASLLDELRRIGADRGRIEVVPLRSHQEASALAPYVYLARGWNRQADVARNPLFYDHTLTPDSYRAWLRHWGVGYVVLPTARPDDAAVAEAAIVAAGYGWLDQVWRDEGWRLFRVADPTPLVDPPATVRQAGPADLTLDVPQAGEVRLRVPWSPWLGVEEAPGGAVGCLSAAGEWTVLHAPAAGTYRIGARYRLTRGAPCRP